MMEINISNIEFNNGASKIHFVATTENHRVEAVGFLPITQTELTSNWGTANLKRLVSEKLSAKVDELVFEVSNMNFSQGTEVIINIRTTDKKSEVYVGGEVVLTMEEFELSKGMEEMLDGVRLNIKTELEAKK